MSPADILATLDRCASRHDCAGDYGHAEELREARAAVAELIAAAHAYRRVTVGKATVETSARLDAALTLAGGAR